MITDNQTDLIYLSDILRTNFSATCNQITSILDALNLNYQFLLNTADIWARDYMPVQISQNKFIEFRYDPDYLQGIKKGERELKTYPDIVCDSLKLKTTKSHIILDGGNVIKSSNSVILTDKIVWENQKLMNREKLSSVLKDTFEVDKIILIPWDELDEYGHADGMLRFMDENTVLINGVYNSDKNFKRKLLLPLEKNGINYEWLKFDVEIEDPRNCVFINFLQTAELMLVPKLNIDEDQQALDQIKIHYPYYAANNKIAQVDITEVEKFGGGLNCISWTIKS